MTFLSDKQLAVRYAVSRQTIWRWSRKGRFPKPVILSQGVTRWRLSDVEAWEGARA